MFSYAVTGLIIAFSPFFPVLIYCFWGIFIKIPREMREEKRQADNARYLEQVRLSLEAQKHRRW